MKQTIILSNGIEMPIIGFGVYQIPPKECEQCVSEALSIGYRMIDTAQAYGNEENVGTAVKKSGIPRDELFLITKIWINNAGYEKAKISIDESLNKLQTDYIDLLLIHQPFNDYYSLIVQWKMPINQVKPVPLVSAIFILTVLSI